MYSLIIVDDEAVIRKGIRDYIDWNAMGFQVAETFEDGKEALEYMKSQDVDVVLTDIEMAEVSGLELAKELRKTKKHQKVVIISGYKEFEYARKAVEYGVEHYLLKPVRMEEVTEVFTKISKELEEKVNAQQDFVQVLPELQEQFFMGLLIGGLGNEESILRKKEVLGIKLDEKQAFALVDLRLETKEQEFLSYYEGENFRNLIQNLCAGEENDIISIPICLSGDVIKIIMTTKREESVEQFKSRAELQIKEKCESARTLLKIHFHAELEQVFTDMMGITSYRCMMPVTMTNEKGSYPEVTQEDYERLMQKYKLLMGIINDGDFEELDGLTENIFHEFRSMPIEQVQKLCIDLFSMLSGKLMKMGIDIWKIWNQKVSYQEFISVKNLIGLKEKTHTLLREVLCIVKETRNVSSRHFVDESIKYMKEHYGEEISLEVIANKFFLNQTYFSRLFKQYTGTTFTDYLIELRMEQAKKLLEQGKYKVYEVSQMVGYRSEKYFFRIFKQYMGCSPTEYYRRKKLHEE